MFLPALMYPHVHWALGGSFRGSKVAGYEASVSFPSSAFLTRVSTAVCLLLYKSVLYNVIVMTCI